MYDLIWNANAGLTPGVATSKLTLAAPPAEPEHDSKSVPVTVIASPDVYAKFPIIAATLAAFTASAGWDAEPTTKTTFGLPLLKNWKPDNPAWSTLPAPAKAAPNMAAPAAAAAILFTFTVFT